MDVFNPMEGANDHKTRTCAHRLHVLSVVGINNKIGWMLNMYQGATEQKLLAKHVKITYDNMPLAVVLQFMLASVFAAMLIGRIENKSVFFWWLAIVAVSMLCFMPFLFFQSAENTIKNPKLWGRWALISYLLQGLVWGGGCSYLLYHQNQIDAFMVVALVAILLGASLTALFSSPILLATFIISYLVPTIVTLLTVCNDMVCYLSAAMLVAFAGFTIYGGTRIALHTKNEYIKEFENKRLEKEIRDVRLHLKGANLQLEKVSATDLLTQVANRRYFDERYQAEWRRAVREEECMSLVFVDIDGFREYNAQFGHQMGDQCLAQIALSIRDALRRPADIVARYGPEEFIVMLPSTPKEGGVRVAEIIRENITMLNIDAGVGAPFPYVTVSSGVSYCEPKENMPSVSLIASAEEAMYQAKRDGRNTVVFKSIGDTVSTAKELSLL